MKPQVNPVVIHSSDNHIWQVNKDKACRKEVVINRGILSQMCGWEILKKSESGELKM